MTARYERLRREGLCVFCSRPAVQGRSRCVVCASLAAEWYAQRRVSTRCISCGARAERFSRCPSCRRSYGEDRISRYRARRAAGRCIQCGASSQRAARCPRCAASLKRRRAEAVALKRRCRRARADR
jgi:hypothetical protein